MVTRVALFPQWPWACLLRPTPYFDVIRVEFVARQDVEWTKVDSMGKQSAISRFFFGCRLCRRLLFLLQEEDDRTGWCDSFRRRTGTGRRSRRSGRRQTISSMTNLIVHHQLGCTAIGFGCRNRFGRADFTAILLLVFRIASRFLPVAILAQMATPAHAPTSLDE